MLLIYCIGSDGAVFGLKLALVYLDWKWCCCTIVGVVGISELAIFGGILWWSCCLYTILQVELIYLASR